MSRFLIKLVVNGVIVVSMLRWLTDATWSSSMFAALGLTIIAYFVGDQLILRGTNNIIAMISDALITVLYLWLVANLYNWTVRTGAFLMIAVVLGVAEFFYHRYLGINDRHAKTES